MLTTIEYVVFDDRCDFVICMPTGEMQSIDVGITHRPAWPSVSTIMLRVCFPFPSDRLMNLFMILSRRLPVGVASPIGSILEHLSCEDWADRSKCRESEGHTACNRR